MSWLYLTNEAATWDLTNELAPHLLQVHALQGRIHPLHHSCHGFSDLWKGQRSLFSDLPPQKTCFSSVLSLVRDPCTLFMVTAVCTLAATASTLALILRKFTDWFFCLMAFSAWIRATSMLPFWIAWATTHKHMIQGSRGSAEPVLNHSDHPTVWSLNSPFSLWPSLLSLPCHIFLSFAATLWLQTSG